MAFWKRKTEGRKLPKFAEPNHKSPEAFILSFCQDYKAWNDFCMAENAAEDRSEEAKLMSRLERIYVEFVAGYVVPNTRLQLISFGTHASFAPDRLSFGTREVADDRLTQKFSIKYTTGDGSDEFIAHLHRSEDHRFQLQQIYYIDPFPDDPLDDQARFLPFL
ncbi:hypothetical protein [Pseudophaeobacter sp.]|uniref:hypothetical protein n=1 Tax=Pseudophaeobacter sp. TaxID=1971739 RepID=UPI00329818C7